MVKQRAECSNKNIYPSKHLVTNWSKTCLGFIQKELLSMVNSSTVQQVFNIWCFLCSLVLVIIRHCSCLVLMCKMSSNWTQLIPLVNSKSCWNEILHPRPFQCKNVRWINPDSSLRVRLKRLTCQYLLIGTIFHWNFDRALLLFWFVWNTTLKSMIYAKLKGVWPYPTKTWCCQDNFNRTFAHGVIVLMSPFSWQGQNLCWPC